MMFVNALIETLKEFWGLFVEDLSLTIGIVLCLAVTAWVLPRLALDSRANGMILFALLAAMLLENVRRSAR